MESNQGTAEASTTGSLPERSALATRQVVLWRQRVRAAVHQARTANAFRMAHAQHVRATDAQLARIGRQLLREQQKAEAECYFRALLHRDPYRISGWLGLSDAVASQELRRTYLQTALDLSYLLDWLQVRHKQQTALLMYQEVNS